MTIKTGIDRLMSHRHLFDGRRVGLITNPTGVNHDLVSSVDLLNEHTDLVALFSPEHGIRGDLQAGVELTTYDDEKTGIPVHSLYGKHKEPTADMLAEIDVLAFDIQDVGARYYTYLYTMAHAMRACRKHDKTFVVFDRPNPVDALTVEGMILDVDFRSFVGYYPIPQRYGLTIGELARMFNEAFSIGCKLHVIPMAHYRRSMDFRATGLDWVFPSPNIPSPETAYTYLATGLFEGTNISEGRGTTKPFTMIGSPFLDAERVIRELRPFQLKGVRFRPVHFTPTFSKHKGTLCQGIELHVRDPETFTPVATGHVLLHVIHRLHAEFEFLAPSSEGRPPFIDLISGTDKVRKNIDAIGDILEDIRRDSKIFAEQKRRYHLYE